MHHLLEGMQHWVKANFFIDSAPSVFSETVEEFFFVELVEGIDNFVGIAYKAINGIDRVVQRFIERLNPQRKRGAVMLGDELATLESG